MNRSRATILAAGTAVLFVIALVLALTPKQKRTMESPTDASVDVSAPEQRDIVTIARGCSALEAANDAALAKWRAEDAGAGCPLEPAVVNCIPTDSNVMWGYLLVDVDYDGPTPRNDERDCRTLQTFELVRQDAAGTRIIAGATEKLTREGLPTQDSIELQALADYDGDGEVEILRTHSHTEYEGVLEQRADLLTFRAGTLSLYEPARHVTFVSVGDIDDDGRPDLLSEGPYSKVTWFDGFPRDHTGGAVPSIFAYHARPDGTFALDGASMAYAKSTCPSRAAVPRLTRDAMVFFDSDVAEKLLCARLWGESTKEIHRAWNAVCARPDAGDAGDEEEQPCQTWATQIADIAPPFVLRPR